jgi:hypothetical protein
VSRKLTIGTVCYRDFEGVFMTIQAIRMYHREVLPDIEFLVIDNDFDSPHGKAVEALTKSVKEPIRYIKADPRGPAAAKDMVFTMAETEYVLVMDCHVMLWQRSLRKLIDYFRSGEDAGNLLQGPLVMDDLQHFSTHFDLSVWSGGMWGQWATDDRGKGTDMPPFEIPAQGMGTFACRRSAWPGFNPRFRGFGGEEGYVHEKFRSLGRKTMCLPFLRWLHRFGRPNGVPYPLNGSDRVHNYLVGFHELGLDPTPIRDHFRSQFSAEAWQAICEGAVPRLRKSTGADGNVLSPGQIFDCCDPLPAQS